jgi:hypothetical protein
MDIPREATEGAFGRIETDRVVYRPLDTVMVEITGRTKGDNLCTIRVCDPEQEEYLNAEVKLENNRGTVSFVTGGRPGNHYVYLQWKGEKHYSRYLNFRLEPSSVIESGDEDFDFLYPFTRETMLLGRRDYNTDSGRFVAYISADTWHFDGIWLRDWIYGLPAYRLWETEMECGIDRFLKQQSEDGMIPDGIERNGTPWRVGLESDVEYLLVLAVWQTWKVTGNDRWMASALPAMEKALNYVRNSSKHWDSRHNLVKRQHSCDTWDFDIDGASDSGEKRYVIATCDQSGYYLAFTAMGNMYRHLERESDAARWEKEAEGYRERAINLLWDGTKFLHHVHLDPIDHGDFDESRQLAMGNTWAVTRGLADGEQARSIIDQYRLRHKETGDAYPWWSLQPGYPDHLGYFSKPFLRQGGYANGGLMPWVGGELCKASFLFGREKYGVELLRGYAEHLRRTGGTQVWYWPDGTPGFRTTNEVRYAGWGMAQWIDALFEGLAGIQDEDCLMRKVTVSPRWAATPVRNVYVSMRYAVSDVYIAYRMDIDSARMEIHMDCTGSGEQALLRVLLPENWDVKSVSIDGVPEKFSMQEEDASRYVVFLKTAGRINRCTISCRRSVAEGGA